MRNRFSRFSARSVSRFTLEVSVPAISADKGLGLVPESIPFLFQRNHQKQMSTDSQKGSGLGLFICKSIVEAHGGTLSAHNEPTGGAVFRFTIPLEG